MKTIKMLSTANGCDVSPGGATLPVFIYEKGLLYEVGDSLAKTFGELNVCEVIEVVEKEKDVDPDTDPDEKQSDDVPENKMQPNESENK